MPITVRFDQNQINRLHKKLGVVQGNNVLVGPVGRGQDRLLDRMQSYTQSNPPKPGNSKYIRTFLTARSWRKERVSKSAHGVQGAIGSKRARPVMSFEDQSSIHRGRWYTDKSVMEDEAPKILADLQRTIDKALKG